MQICRKNFFTLGDIAIISVIKLSYKLLCYSMNKRTHNAYDNETAIKQEKYADIDIYDKNHPIEIKTKDKPPKVYVMLKIILEILLIKTFLRHCQC